SRRRHTSFSRDWSSDVCSSDLLAMSFIYKSWWKVLGVILAAYSMIAGFLVPVPELPIVYETIRNLYYHVPMWFTMTALFTISVLYSIKYLSKPDEKYDYIAVECINAGLV